MLKIKSLPLKITNFLLKKNKIPLKKKIKYRHFSKKNLNLSRQILKMHVMLSHTQ